MTSLPGGLSEQIDDDIALVVGGHFAIDHIGAEAYEAVLGRIAADPAAYLTVFRERYLRGDLTPLVASELFLPRLLEIVADTDRVGAIAAAAELLERLEGTSVSPAQERRLGGISIAEEEAARANNRLERQRRQLQELLG